MSAENPFAHLRIRKYDRWDLFLHRQQHYLGRTYAWLRRDGRMHLQGVTRTERDEFFDVILPRVHEALSVLFGWDEQVDLLNVAWLGNEESHGHHGHFHLIPRYFRPPSFDGVEWEADLRWGKNYAPYPKRETSEKKLLFIRDGFRRVLK
jgi:diadenosine tetraphosphate (Ap4A) HIT family hydrolase